jgi:hypothetical protein
MMLVVLLSCALAAQAAPEPAPAQDGAPKRPKLLVLDVKSGDLTPDQIDALTAVVAARAQKFGQVDVASAQDIRDLADVEAQKQAAGCDGDGCLAELAGALGARYVLATRAGKLGSSYVVAVQLYDAEKGEAQARDTAEAFSIDDLSPKLITVVDGALESALGPPQDRTTTAAPAATSTDGARAGEQGAPIDPVKLGLQIGGASAIIVGGALAGFGVAPLLLYNQKKGQLNQATRDYEGKQDQLDDAAALHEEAIGLRELYNGPGRVMLVSGSVVLVLGVGALATGLVMPPMSELMEGQ